MHVPNNGSLYVYCLIEESWNTTTAWTEALARAWEAIVSKKEVTWAIIFLKALKSQQFF